MPLRRLATSFRPSESCRRRLLAGFVEDLAKAVADNQVLTGLQGHGYNLQARRPAGSVLRCGIVSEPPQNPTGIAGAQHIDAGVTVAQLLFTFCQRQTYSVRPSSRSASDNYFRL